MKFKEPKDLGIKIGSKEEVFWTKIKDTIKEQITQAQAQIAMNKHMLPFVERKILEEQRRGKPLNKAE